MTTSATRAGATTGSPVTRRLPPSSRPAIEAALDTLHSRRITWATLPVLDKIDLLRRLRRSFLEVADEWVEACEQAEGLASDDARTGEEWVAGPYLVIKNLRLLQVALRNISIGGRPRIPGEVTELPDGRAAARAFPFDIWDRILYPGVTADVWMQPGVTPAELAETQAEFYARENDRGGVTLVLSAGNVSSIGPMDTIYQLFVEGRVVVYKTHPLNAYLGPLLERGFRPLVEAGFLRIVYGGVDEGVFLCRHPSVDEIHITGSDTTYDAIVFGSGAEGRERKADARPLLDKPISAELGNVSPVIVVPGEWSPKELQYQAENVASMITNNAGFNCNAIRVLVTHREWPQEAAFLDALRRVLDAIPTRRAFYPGATERWQRFVDAHPEAERLGRPAEGELPWTFVPDVAPDREDLCLTTESFCSLFCGVSLPAETVAAFLDQATELCNDRIWGTLNATLIIDPRTEGDPSVAPAVSRAIAELRYGTVSVNNWAAIGYALVVTPWGAYPGHEPTDIRSGTGTVHNTLMFSKVEKTVIRSPFVTFPKPPWFVTHRQSWDLFRKLTYFEASPAIWRLPAIFARALTG